MPRKREERLEEWISSQEAQAILTHNSDHPIGDRYVRHLANAGRVAWKQVSGHDKLYKRSDVEQIIVRKKTVKATS